MKYILLVTILFFTPWAFAELDELPKPLKMVSEQGGEIVDQFDAPAGMKGYIADFKGQVITLYVTADGQYLFSGAMLDEKGNNIGEKAVQRYVNGPKSENDWKQLESSNWIVDGSPTAKRIIYTFTDPNCPYCKKLWRNARPWIVSGKVQIRHVLVGILKANSLGKAASILAAENPTEILRQHESGNLSPELNVLKDPSQDVLNKLQVNHQTMMALGVSATPATFYRDAAGTVQKLIGLPQEPILLQIFGPVDEN